MISGGEGRGKHCSSHCRHWQAQRKVMSNHYFPGPFGMQISHNLLMTSKTQIPTSGTPTHGFLAFTLWKVSHLNKRSRSQHVGSSEVQQEFSLCRSPLLRPCCSGMGHICKIYESCNWWGKAAAFSEVWCCPQLLHTAAQGVTAHLENHSLSDTKQLV